MAGLLSFFGDVGRNVTNAWEDLTPWEEERERKRKQPRQPQRPPVQRPQKYGPLAPQHGGLRVDNRNSQARSSLSVGSNPVRQQLAMGKSDPSTTPLSALSSATKNSVARRDLSVNRASADAFNATPERKRMEPLFRQGRSYEEIAATAGFSDREVREYAKKYHPNYGDNGPIGNVTRGVGQFIDTTARNAAGIISDPINDIRSSVDKDFRNQQEQKLREINRRFQQGTMSGEGAFEQAGKVGERFTNLKPVQRKNGEIALERGNPLDFLGKFTQQGIDTVSVAPVGGGVAQGASQVAKVAGKTTAQEALERAANVLSAGTRSQSSSRLTDELVRNGVDERTANIIGNAITSNAKQAAVYGTAQTGADVASGRGVTPESLALNYGADFLMGALPEIGIGSAAPSIVRGGQAAGNIADDIARGANPDYAARSHPAVQELDSQYGLLQQQFDVASNEIVRRQTQRAMLANRVERQRQFKQVFNEAKIASQGGFIAGPLAGDFSKAQKAGRVFEGVDGKPRFEVDDSGAKIKNLQGKTLKEVIDHPELFSQYPELKNVNTIYDEKLGGSAEYNPNKNTIKFGKDADPALLMHEIQHSIQEVEGFAKGGSPEKVNYLRDLKFEELNQQEKSLKNSPAYEELAGNLRSAGQPPAMLDHILFGSDKTRSMLIKNGMPKTLVGSIRKHPLAEMLSQELRDIQVARRTTQGYGVDDMDAYRRLAGEAEARAVQARMNMPMSERYVKPDPKNFDTFYHGSKTDFDKFDFSKSKTAAYGKGAYLAQDMKQAKFYGDVVSKQHVPKDANLFALTDELKKAEYKHIQDIYKQKTGKELSVYGDGVATPDDWRIFWQDTNSSMFKDAKELWRNKLVGDGYDGIRIKGTGKNDDVVAIFSPDKLYGDKQLATPRSTFYDSLDVPKDDLIIRNGDGKAMSIDGDPANVPAGKNRQISKRSNQQPEEFSPTMARKPEIAGNQSVVQRNAPFEDSYTTKDVDNQEAGRVELGSEVDELFPEAPKVQRLSKQEKQEIDAIIAEEDPNLLYRTSDLDTRKLTEAGDDKLPRIHVNDLKRYFGNTENIPAKYKRKTGDEDIDLLAKNAGFNDVDEYMESFQGELQRREQLRADKELLKEYRNDPDMIKRARERIAAQPKQVKVKGAARDKNVPVRKLEHDRDTVVAKNVNPNARASEKRYTVDEDGKLIEDKKGATSLFTDGEGRISGFRVGKDYFDAKDLGDLSTVNGNATIFRTMRRNVESSFDKPTGDKVNKFLVDYQQDQATKLIDRQVKLKKEMETLASDLGINFRKGTKEAKQVSAAIQDFGEGVRNKTSLVEEFGEARAQKIVNADKWFRKNYNQMLDEMNSTLKEFGYDPVPKRKNYYTHFQDETVWQRFGLKMQEIRDLSSPTMQDANPISARGKIDNKMAGQTENLQPNKKFNKFALQRKGDKHTSDAFKAFELYLNPTLNNIYMTPAIARARVISKAIAQDANITGKDANATIVQVREWANRLAGKSNRIGDRQASDSKYGRNILKALSWTQKVAGQNTIVGNLSTAVMQPIVTTQGVGRFGVKNQLTGFYQEATGMLAKEQQQSGFLRRRYSDVSSVTKGKMESARNVANEPLRFVEEHATRSIWNAAYNDARAQGLKGDNAIRYADNNTEKTVAGRSIGEKPEIFESKSAGLATMYQLEVANFWHQMGREMTKKQAAKTLVAMYGFNLGLQAISGRQVGFNPIDAAIDSFEEMQKDRSTEENGDLEKAKRIGQRWAGEFVDNLPIVGMAANTMFGEKNIKEFTGDESNVGRFGASSPIRTLFDNPWMAVSPFGGSQVKKTAEGATTVSKGKLEDKDGNTLVNVPQSPENWIKGTLFGNSAIPEVNQYYNNLGKSKIDQRKVQNQTVSKAAGMSMDGLTKQQQEMVATATDANKASLIAEYQKANQADYKQDKIDEKNGGKSAGSKSTTNIKNEGIKSLREANEERSDKYRKSFSDDDWALIKMSKRDQEKLVKNGSITQKKLDGLKAYDEGKRKELGYTDTRSSSYDVNDKISSSSKKVLEKYYSLDDDQRETWFREKNSNEYEYWKAKYENSKANGEISKIEEVKWRYNLRKDKVGKDFSKDSRDLYGLAKYKIAEYLKSDKNGEKLAQELIEYDRKLYESGVTRYLKFKNGFASSSGGSSGGRRSRGGGRRRSGGRGGSKGSGVTEGKSKISLIRQMNNLRAPQVAGMDSSAPSAPQMKKAGLKRYTVTQAKANARPLKITRRKARI